MGYSWRKTDINSHPHLSFDNKICLVHNGIIENFKELKNDLINKGIKFISETETEIIVNLLAYEYQFNKNFIEVISKVNSILQGTWGLAIINIDYPETLFATCCGSPLLIGKNDDEVMIVSEKSGFCNKMNDYFVLKNYDIAQLNYNKIKTINNYNFNKIDKNKIILTPDPYLYWTLKEIYEQYESSLNAISHGGRLMKDNVKLGGLELNKDELKDVENLILLACGTSYYAGLYSLNIFKEICDFNTVHLYDGAEFYEKDIPKKRKNSININFTKWRNKRFTSMY